MNFRLRVRFLFAFFFTALMAQVSFPLKARGQAAWVVTSLDHFDLWYHGLAVVGFQGFAPLPMYSVDYAAEIRAAKEARGIFPTPLDSLASRFRRGFENDSTFEILHFAPLYFASSDRTAMLSALKASLNGDAVAPGTEQFGAGIIQSLVATDRQRSLLLDFISAIESEWRLFYRDYRNSMRDTIRSTLEVATSFWNDSIASADAFPAQHQLEGGVIVVSPAIGAEGRIFQGASANPIDNVIAVTLPASGSPVAIASHALHEACFPLASDLVAELGVARDRVVAERISSRAAIRCGAMILRSVKPDMLERYQAIFLQYAPNVSSSTTFESAFPADRRILREIEQALDR